MRYFQLKEFDSPDLPGSGEYMQKDFLKMLDEARHLAGIPFIVNSAFRTKKHNSLIGGRVGSSHLNGCAVDLRVHHSGDREKVLKALIMVGFNRIGIADTFIHADNDKFKDPAIWLY